MMRFIFSMIAAVLVAATVQAEGMRDAQDIASKAQDIASKLAIPPSQGWTRPGIVMTHPEGKPDAPLAVDLNVNFEFNSAKLKAEGAVLVGNLGRVLNYPRLTGKRFRIEGHTDAKGSDAYNQSLSERRAEAVRYQLISVYRVDPARLESVGFGKSQLLDRANPEAGVNRRVRVINLGE